MLIVPPDRGASPTGNGFAAQDRAIFRYRLGADRPDWYGDPLAIETRYEECLANKNPTAIGTWLRRENLSVRLLGLRRLLPVILAGFGLPAFSDADPDGLSSGEALRLLERFFKWQDRFRAVYRREAEMLVTYGPMPGRAPTFEREVGLWLNRGRAQAFAGLAHWRGAIAAAGAATAHFDLVDAMAGSIAEAHDLASTIENNRLEAEAQAKKR